MAYLGIGCNASWLNSCVEEITQQILGLPVQPHFI
jgi:hypothetical protein